MLRSDHKRFQLAEGTIVRSLRKKCRALALASVETLASLAALKQKLKKKRHKLTRTRAAFMIRRSVTLLAWLQSLLHAFPLQSKQ